MSAELTIRDQRSH